MKQMKQMKQMKKRGGGFTTGSPLSQQAYYVPEYISKDDCYNAVRPGAIPSNPNPDLAQTPMAGGYRAMNNCKAMAPIGSIQSNPRPNLAQTPMAGGNNSRRKYGGCGCGLKYGGMHKNKQTRRKYTLRNKSKKSKKSRKYGRKVGGRYAIEPSTSIGGDGPIMVPTYSSIPCEGHRAMPINPANPSAFVDAGNPEINLHGVRPAFIQTGGNPVVGSHPLAYEAPRAGFSFVPNIAQGEPLKPGMIPYENVVPQVSPCIHNCGHAIATINKQ